MLEKNLIHHEYVRNYTNASFLVKDTYGFHEGLFSGYDPAKRTYDTSTWAYEGDAAGLAAMGSSTRARCSSSCGSTTPATRPRW